MSFFKELVYDIMHNAAVLFNSYAIAYIVAGIVAAIVATVCATISNRAARKCDQLIPYVSALESEIDNKNLRDDLLGKLYSINHYSAIPSIIAGAIYVIFCLVIYPSLLAMPNDVSDIPVNFLWVEDVTSNKIDFFTFLLYGIETAVSTLVPAAIAKKLTSERIKMCLLSFMLSLVIILFASHIFTVMVVFYLVSKGFTLTIFNSIKAKKAKPLPELIIPEDIKAYYQLHQRHISEGGELEETSE